MDSWGTQTGTDNGAAGGAARATLVVGHRGAPRVARENTLPALRAGIDAGAHWLEVDVRLTRCGTPVLLHDATLHRLWGDRRTAASLTVDQIAQITRTAQAGGPGRERIPTLCQGLELARDAGRTLMIDLPTPAEAYPALALVREFGLLGEVVFAGNRTALGLVRAEAPRARIALSWESPLLPGARVLDRTRPDYLNVEHHRLSRGLVQRAHRLGLGVSAWTVDRARRMARLTALGVDVIITNDPATLVRVLADRADG
ncbi:glycerophosphodiester phosphodiesterase [Streptacidiphilus sp. EB129]|uniref:glycerophosphodiester phosphodiesterase n=1 Tax=Streptacidiphilus sp. EB129 TaxID=3156262 RepID=UPI003518F518